MLNYFLLQLVGPQRKSLSLKDPEKYEFRPKQLLKQVSHTPIFLVKLIVLDCWTWSACCRTCNFLIVCLLNQNKKLQHCLTDLSGGNKTVNSIIFCFLLITPLPFNQIIFCKIAYAAHFERHID